MPGPIEWAGDRLANEFKFFCGNSEAALARIAELIDSARVSHQAVTMNVGLFDFTPSLLAAVLRGALFAMEIGGEPARRAASSFSGLGALLQRRKKPNDRLRIDIFLADGEIVVMVEASRGEMFDAWNLGLQTTAADGFQVVGASTDGSRCLLDVYAGEGGRPAGS